MITKIRKNDLCHCGSGKKYEKCCLQNDLKKWEESSQSSDTDNTYRLVPGHFELNGRFYPTIESIMRLDTGEWKILLVLLKYTKGYMTAEQAEDQADRDLHTAFYCGKLGGTDDVIVRYINYIGYLELYISKDLKKEK